MANNQIFLTILCMGVLLGGCSEAPTATPLPTTVAATETIRPTDTARATVVADVSATTTLPSSVAATSTTSSDSNLPVAPSASAEAPDVTVTGTPDNLLFLPSVNNEPATETPTLVPSMTPTTTPTPIPTINVASLRTSLSAQGQALAFSKAGFHIGVGGNRSGLGDWMQRHDEAGVPFFLKSVSDAGPLVEAQDLMRKSGVPHTLVFRVSGDAYDTPNYDLAPAEAARQHWARHMEVWPPELDPTLVWLETINEVDKNQSEWLGQFALETAALAARDGFKWAAFGFASGEPEPTHWQSPSMLAFLRLAAANPDQLAIALHEYSYLIDDIGHEYPFKVGRFQQLFDICDANGIPRPTILITEWGWEYQDVPTPPQAIRDIEWAAALYAPYPEIKGFAIWYLGPGFGGIANQTQRLIAPVMTYNLTHYFTAPPVDQRAPIEPDRYRP